MSHALPTLAIDVRPLSRGHGGIQKYTKEMLIALVLAKQYRIILYTDKAISGLPNTVKQQVTIRTSNVIGVSRLLWLLVVPIWAYKDQIDYFWSPRHHLPLFTPRNCKKVITIHDFVWKVAPSTMPGIQRISERLLMPLSIQRSDLIICVSRSTRNQLLNFFPCAKEKSNVIYHGCNTVRNVSEKHTKHDPEIFLAVGTLEPRKNYTTLLKAFEAYRQRGGKKRLVIVGKNGWKYKTIYKQLEQSEYRLHIEVYNDCSNDKLIEFYQTAHSFISPSIYEGYGLPPQEAQANGLPLLLSNIDVYRELYPDADVWVDPASVSSIADGLEDIDRLTSTNNQSKVPKVRTWGTATEELLKCLATL